MQTQHRHDTNTNFSNTKHWPLKLIQIKCNISDHLNNYITHKSGKTSDNNIKLFHVPFPIWSDQVKITLEWQKCTMTVLLIICPSDFYLRRTKLIHLTLPYMCPRRASHWQKWKKLKADNPTLLHACIIPGTHKYSENLGAISKILGARTVTYSKFHTENP